MKHYFCLDCEAACYGGPNARRCRSCSATHRKAAQAAWSAQAEVRAAKRLRDADYRAREGEKVKRAAARRYAASRDVRLAYAVAYRASEKGREVKRKSSAKYSQSEKGRDNQAKYYATPKGRACRARALARYKIAIGRQLFPGSLAERHSAAAEAFYAARPDGMSIDHIVPLNGRNVSGLHVPWNLQYLTPSQNNVKNNRMPLPAQQRYIRP